MSGSLRVLLVDDSEEDATLIVRELRRAGHDPVARRVINESTMRAALDGASWDVVLCDSSMPGFSAAAAASVLAETNPDLPLILVSGSAQPLRATADALALGARQFVPKSELWRLSAVLELELVAPAPSDPSSIAPAAEELDADDLRRLTRDEQHWAALGRVTGSIANELNDILAIVLASSSPLMTTIERNHPARPHLEEIEKAALRATALMQEALAFGKSRAWNPALPKPPTRGPRKTGRPILLRDEILEAASLVGLNLEFVWQLVQGESRAALGDARKALDRIVDGAKSIPLPGVDPGGPSGAPLRPRRAPRG